MWQCQLVNLNGSIEGLNNFCTRNCVWKNPKYFSGFLQIFRRMFLNRNLRRISKQKSSRWLTPDFSGAMSCWDWDCSEKVTIFLVSESDKFLAVDHQGRCRTVCPIWPNSSGGQSIKNWGRCPVVIFCGFQGAKLEIWPSEYHRIGISRSKHRDFTWFYHIIGN